MSISNKAMRGRSRIAADSSFLGHSKAQKAYAY
jgi:hypothetical protein